MTKVTLGLVNTGIFLSFEHSQIARKAKRLNVCMYVYLYLTYFLQIFLMKYINISCHETSNLRVEINLSGKFSIRCPGHFAFYRTRSLVLVFIFKQEGSEPSEKI